MATTWAPVPTVRPQRDWMSIFQLIFSSMVFFLTAGAGILLLLGNKVFLAEPALKSMGALPASMLAQMGLSSLALSIFAFISVISSARKVDQKPAPSWMGKPMRWLYFLPVLAITMFATGYLTFNRQAMAKTWMPLFSVLIIWLMGLWYFRIGSGHSWGKTPQRSSGLITFGMNFTMPLILAAELILGASILVVLAILLQADPKTATLYTELMQSFLQGGMREEALDQLFTSILENKSVLLLLMLTICAILPFVEELLKPFGIYLLKGRGISPKEGLAAGLASGLAFGMLESLMYVSMANPGTGAGPWALLVLGRSASMLMHMLTTGIIGYGTANSWRVRKRGNLFKAYLIAFLIHGLWNLLAILGSMLPSFKDVFPYILILMFCTALIVYILFTRSVKQDFNEA